MPPRITLQTGLDARDSTMWKDTVSTVTERQPPFTVRLVGPELVDERTVCLRVVGRTMRELRDALHTALETATFVPDESLVPRVPVLPLAGTWTGFNRMQLHELSTTVRNEIGPTIEFTATTLYVFEESTDEDLPFLEFPLGHR